MINILEYFSSNNHSSFLRGKYSYADIRSRIDQSTDCHFPQKVALSIENQESFIIQLLLLLAKNCQVTLFSGKEPLAQIENLMKERSIDLLVNDRSLQSSQVDCIGVEENCKYEGNQSKYEPSITLFTSGSTGKARPLEFTLEKFFASAKSTLEFYDITKPSSFLLSLPMNHMGGLMIMFRSILNNGELVPTRPNQLTFEGDIDYASLVATQLQRVLKDQKLLDKFQRAKGIILGGAETSHQLLKQAISSKLILANSFGMTETLAQVSSTSLTQDLSVLQTVGKSLPGYKIQIKNEVISISGGPLANGITTIEGLDRGILDHEGNLVLLGRADSQFISGGENISPREIENVFIENKFVEHVYCVGVYDKEYGKVPILFSDPLLNFDQINIPLPPYKMPRATFPLPPLSESPIKYSRSHLQVWAQIQYLHNNYGYHYQWFGDPLGEPVIMLHGFMGSCSDFNEVIKEVLKINPRKLIICFQIPGHFCPIDEDLNSPCAFIDHLAAFILNLDRKVTLFGYSMGGRIAAHLAIAAKDNISKLILESASFGMDSGEAKDMRLKADRSLFHHVHNKRDFENFLRSWYELPLWGEIKTHPLFSNLIQNRLQQNWDQLQKSINIFSPAQFTNCQSEVENLQMEKLYLVGSLDSKYLDTSRNLRNFKVRIVDACGHNTHFQSPGSLAQILGHS